MNKLTTTILTVTMITISLLIGANQLANATNNNLLIETTTIQEVTPINVITASTSDFYLDPNTIAIEYNNGSYKMLEVNNIETTETGTLITFVDGTGYYIEGEQ